VFKERTLALVFLVMIALATGACSLKPAESKGVSVRLAPRAGSLVEHLLTETLSTFTTMGSSLTSLTDLNCFAVNVTGGSIDTASICHGVTVGIVDGSYTGITTTFSPLVPLQDGLTFEAYGTAASGCPILNGNDPIPNALYKIGSVTANLSQGAAPVTIPVAFDASQVHGCSNAPYVVFSDTFDYASGQLTSASSGGVWTKETNPGGTAGVTISSVPDVQASLSIGIDFATTLVTNDKPYYSISYTDTGSAAGGNTLKFIAGLACDTSATPIMMGCELDSTTVQVNMIAGTGTGGFPNGTFNFGSTTQIAPPIHVFCELLQQPDGKFIARGTLTNAAGVQILPPFQSAEFSRPCPGSSLHPYIQNGTSTGGFPAGGYDSLQVDTADTSQP
jgi:hypothetical protein